MIIWIIGLSGSGKSTIGKIVYEKIKKSRCNTVLVDGDKVRKMFNHNEGDSPYSVEGRAINAKRIMALCEWLDQEEINVVCCIQSIFHEDQEWNRKSYSSYFEVFLDVPFEELRKRRKYYNQAIEGKIKNVVGVDIEFKAPVRPNLILNNSENGKGVTALADIIVENVVSDFHEK